MSGDQAVCLINETGGKVTNGVVIPASDVHVEYVRIAMFCYADGDDVIIKLSADNKISNWHTKPWSDGC